MCTLKVHMVKSFETKARFYNLWIFRIATYDNPFYAHWHCRPGDLTDPCGHMDLPVPYAVNEKCTSCFQGGTGSSWIRCPVCSQWCHDKCYDN